MGRKRRDREICGAKRGNGRICKKLAGFGTQHFGEGKCMYHMAGTDADTRKSNRFLEALMDEDVRHRAMTLLEDEDLLDCRAELAILKVRMEEVGFEEDTSVGDLTKLGNAIARLASTIQEMERGKQHFLHVTVTGAIISAFADIGRTYITDPATRYWFEKEIEGVIRMAIKKRSARMIATSILAPKVSDIIPAESQIMSTERGDPGDGDGGEQ